jgi:phage anti-repressor protein
MTEMQELYEQLLNNRINEESLKENKDFSDIMVIMNIFLAGSSITPLQFARLTKLITLANVGTTSTTN